MELTIIKTNIKEEYGKSGKNYAVLMCQEQEVGFINEFGIFLKIYNPGVKTGVYNRVELQEKNFVELCRFVEKHWNAMYDRYDLFIKKQQPRTVGKS